MTANLPVVRLRANESWIILIWVKRLSPFILIALLGLVYHFGNKYLERRRAAEQSRIAHLTAEVWVATAKYRDDPDRYVRYRDSLMAAEHVSNDDIDDFLKRYEDKPERYLPFAQIVQSCVDSLVRIEDSLVRDAKIKAADSLRAADRR